MTDVPPAETLFSKGPWDGFLTFVSFSEGGVMGVGEVWVTLVEVME